jgi:ribonuclease HII
VPKIYIFEHANRLFVEDYFLHSFKYSAVLAYFMYVAGIDEAGRGPAMGPMAMAIVSVKKSDEFKLRTMGVKDSKKLSAKKREELAVVIRDIGRSKVVLIDAKEVDKAVLSPSDNLNWLEARKSAELVNMVNPDQIVFDCPSTNLESYKQYIKNKIKKKKMKILVEHKADENHLTAAAASILAKVSRDAEIEKIKKKIKKDFGSGYASDPKTQAFIEKYWEKKEYQKYFRQSWETLKRRKDAKKQRSLDDF